MEDNPFENLDALRAESAAAPPPKKKRSRNNNGLYIPSIPLAWYLQARAAAATHSQLDMMILIWREWVIQGRDVLEITASASSGGARRRLKSTLAALASKGLAEMLPVPRNRAAQVRLLFPPFNIPRDVIKYTLDNAQ